MIDAIAATYSVLYIRMFCSFLLLVALIPKRYILLRSVLPICGAVGWIASAALGFLFAKEPREIWGVAFLMGVLFSFVYATYAISEVREHEMRQTTRGF